MKRFSAETKKWVLDQVDKYNRKVSEVCKEIEISRKTYYRWKKQSKNAKGNQQLAKLKPRFTKGNRHWKAINPKIKKQIVTLVAQYPLLSLRALQLKLEEYGIKVSASGLHKYLDTQDLNKPEQRKILVNQFQAPRVTKPVKTRMRLEPASRLKLIREVEKGKQTVQGLSHQYHVSRKTIYKWLKRYRAGDSTQLLAAMSDQFACGRDHYRAISPETEARLLRLISTHPEYSARTLTNKLTTLWGRPELGYHGVYNLLRRHHLTRKQARIAWAQAQTLTQPSVTPALGWLSRLRLALGWFIPSLAPAPPPAFRSVWLRMSWLASVISSGLRLGYLGFLGILRFTTQLPSQVASLTPSSVSSLLSNFFRYQFKPLSYSFLITFIIALGSLWYLDLLSSAPSWSARIGYLFASLSLASGTLFFLYSAKYYLMLAAVLSFSQSENDQSPNLGSPARGTGKQNSEEQSSPSALANHQAPGTSNQPGDRMAPGQGLVTRFVSWLFGATPSKRLGDAAIGLQASLDQVTIKDDQYPKMTVCLPVYNEKRVVERLLKACTGFDYQGNYQVLVLDDSTDETTDLIKSLINITPSHQPPASSQKPTIKQLPPEASSQQPAATPVQVWHSTLNGVPVTLVHRQDRTGFKGGALAEALRHTDPDSVFTVVFDADFIPFPDTLKLFVKYFKAAGAWNETSTWELVPSTRERPRPSSLPLAYPATSNQAPDPRHQLPHPEIVAVQGYQWHVLNKNENWITRGVRTEYSGSYVIERSGLEIFSGLKQIAGSVYAVKTAVLRELGWGTSITEDFQLTLKLYQRGYKVLYTPYIQGPAECVSTLKRLIRQRMRWAEGHSHNIRKMLVPLLFNNLKTEDREPKTAFEDRRQKTEALSPSSTLSPQTQSSVLRHPSSGQAASLTFSEKLELLFLSPYYLQAAFFLVGTTCWLISEAILRSPLPFWTSVWGWSLVLTNFFSLPLSNSVGLFMEEAEERDYLGITSFILLSYLLVPFQAYASIKGLIESEEQSTWFRTPKSGKITISLTRGRFYRWLHSVLPGRSPALAKVIANHAPFLNFTSSETSHSPYLALATANNRFNSFAIKPKKRMKWVSKIVLSLLLVFTVTVYSATRGVPEVLATPSDNLFAVDSTPSGNMNTSWQLQDNTWGTDNTGTSIKPGSGNTGTYQFDPGLANNATTDATPTSPDENGWVYDTAFESNGSINSDPWTFRVCLDVNNNDSDAVAYLRVIVHQVELTGTAPNMTINSNSIIYDSTTDFQGTDIYNDDTNNQYFSFTSPASINQVTFTGSETYLYAEYFAEVTIGGDNPDYIRFHTGDGSCTNDPAIDTPSWTIPENVVVLVALSPFIPLVAIWMKRKRRLAYA